MTATVHSLRPEPPDPLDELNADRERLGQELQRFAIVDERRVAAETKIANLDAALVALDRADREAVEKWAETAEGEPPPPLLAERKALMARQLDSEAERRGAEITAGAVQAKRIALIHEFNRVGREIKEIQVAGIVRKGRDLHSDVIALAAEIGEKMMKIEALRQVLTEEQAAAVNQHDDAKTAIVRAAVAEVEALRPPEVLADRAVVDRYAAAWREALR